MGLKLQLRSERSVPWREWTRGVGLLLVALAAATALGPDWPMSAAELERRVQRWALDPRPSGELEDVPGRFEWGWRGEPATFELLFLDRELAELAVVAVGAVTSWVPTPEMAARLREAGQFYWVIRATTRGGVTTTAPNPVRLRRG